MLPCSSTSGSSPAGCVKPGNVRCTLGPNVSTASTAVTASTRPPQPTLACAQVRASSTARPTATAPMPYTPTQGASQPRLFTCA